MASSKKRTRDEAFGQEDHHSPKKRTKTGEHTVSELAASLQPQPRIKTRVSRTLKIGWQIRPPLSEKYQWTIIRHRYGSIYNYDKVHRKPAQIARLLNLSLQTVCSVIRRFKERGNIIQDRRKFNARPSKMPDVLQRFLLSRETLEAWKFYTLAQRCKLVKQDFGIRLGLTTLHQFYRRHRIRPRFQNFKYYGAQFITHQEKYQFALRLAELRMKQAPMIFADESSCHQWMQLKKLYSYPDQYISQEFTKKRGKACTIYGGIGSVLKKGAFFFQGRTTNMKIWTQYLEKLRTQCTIDPKEEIHLVIDNHPSHVSRNMQSVYDRLRFKPLFIPKYTPEFNR